MIRFLLYHERWEVAIPDGYLPGLRHNPGRLEEKSLEYVFLCMQDEAERRSKIDVAGDSVVQWGGPLTQSREAEKDPHPCYPSCLLANRPSLASPVYQGFFVPRSRNTQREIELDRHKIPLKVNRSTQDAHKERSRMQRTCLPEAPIAREPGMLERR